MIALHSKQCCNDIATLCCAKNRLCESPRVALPLGTNQPHVNAFRDSSDFKSFLQALHLINYPAKSLVIQKDKIASVDIKRNAKRWETLIIALV